MPKNSCSCFDIVGTRNAWTLSTVALGKILVLSNNMAPRNLTGSPGSCTFHGFIAHPLSCEWAVNEVTASSNASLKPDINNKSSV